MLHAAKRSLKIRTRHRIISESLGTLGRTILHVKARLN